MTKNINPVLPYGLDVEAKRRYLIGWMADLKQLNYPAWEKTTTIEIVKRGRVVAEFKCNRGQVTMAT